jgi:transposase
MLTQEEHVEISALRKRGWSISAIARHLGASRNTVRAYLSGGRRPGERQRPTPDLFEPYAEYVSIRLRDDPHLWGSALYDEAVKLGYQQSYVSFVRQVRHRGLRPVCEACGGSRSRATIEIAHPPGEEIQWDWVELPSPWEESGQLHLLQGTLPYSGKTRGAFAESEEQAHLVEAIDKVLRELGGTSRRWRFDRMATVAEPKTGRLRESFAQVALHYQVAVAICPAYRAKRKGAVERAQDFSAQRWFRTAHLTNLEQAQTAYDRFCAKTGDGRPREGGTVAELAEREHLLPLPAHPYPATVEAARVVGDSSLVAFRGNRYGVNPGLEGAVVTVRHRLGSAAIEIVSAAGAQLAQHRRQPDGAGVIVRSPEQQAALEKVVLANFATARPCSRKVNRPPSPEALEAARMLTALTDREVVIDLGLYAALAQEVAG